MYKKKFDKRYWFIILIVLIALILVVLAISLKKDRDLNPFERVAKDISTVVIKVVKTPFDFVGNQIKAMNEKDNLYKKYKKLQNKKEKIDSVNAENDNLKDEVKKLKEALQLKTTLSDQYQLSATITSRNIGYWYEEVTIDKGSKDGVKKNMAVVTSKGLIGSTTKVSNHSSTIKLLSNDNMSDKISVKIKTDDDYVYGLISSYNSKTNTYTVEGISENVTIPKNADVVTTGMGNIFPSGLMIGKVKGMTTDNFDLSKVLEVKSSVDFDNLDYVTVLKRKE